MRGPDEKPRPLGDYAEHRPAAGSRRQMREDDIGSVTRPSANGMGAHDRVHQHRGQQEQRERPKRTPPATPRSRIGHHEQLRGTDQPRRDDGVLLGQTGRHHEGRDGRGVPRRADRDGSAARRRKKVRRRLGGQSGTPPSDVECDRRHHAERRQQLRLAHDVADCLDVDRVHSEKRTRHGGGRARQDQRRESVHGEAHGDVEQHAYDVEDPRSPAPPRPLEREERQGQRPVQSGPLPRRPVGLAPEAGDVRELVDPRIEQDDRTVVVDETVGESRYGGSQRQGAHRERRTPGRPRARLAAPAAATRLRPGFRHRSVLAHPCRDARGARGDTAAAADSRPPPTPRPAHSQPPTPNPQPPTPNP